MPRRVPWRTKMTRSVVPIGVLLAVLLVALVGWRRAHSSDVPLPELEEERAISANGSNEPLMTKPLRRPRRTVSPRQTALAPVALTQVQGAAQEAAGDAPWAEKSRDGYYERLMVKQGRDQVKESQLQSRLMAEFGNDPDTLVGPVACSTQFCRVELRGFGEVDVRQRWQDRLFSAVEPKGLKFFVVIRDDDDTTITSCYFGRDKSWTVPDFRAAGLM
jgi:hypothetical protein